MNNALTPPVTSSSQESVVLKDSSESMSRMVHALANKLLPITVFSELALRHCHDPKVIKDLERIYQAAEEARELIMQIRTDSQSDSTGTPT